MASTRTNKVLNLSLGHTLVALASLGAGMVMARMLSQAELATYRQTMLAYEVLIPLLSLGVPSGIYYFLPTEKRRARGLVVSGVLLMVCMAGLYDVFIALGGNHLLAQRFSNPAISDTLVYLMPLPIFMLPAGLLASVLVVQDQVYKLTVYNVISSLLLAFSVIAACYVWKNPKAIVLARVLVGIVTGIVAIILIINTVPKDDWRPSWDDAKRMTSFSVPLVAAGALGTISLQLDKLIVSAMCTPEEFAVYSNGAIEIPLIGVVTGSIATIILPDLRRLLGSGNFIGALELFHKAAEKSAVLLIPAMMFLLVSAESFILTLFSAKYSGSILPFRLYLLILPVRIVFYGSMLTALGKTNVILVRTVISLMINVLLCVVFVNLFGYIGAIIATLLTLYLWGTVFNIVIIAKALRIRCSSVLPFFKLFKVFVVSLLGIPAVLLSRIFFDLPPLLGLITNALIYFPITLTLFVVFDLTPVGVNQVLEQVLLRVRRVFAV